MNPESEEAEHVNIQRTEGNSTESASAIDPVDQIFDRFKSYINTKLGAFKTNWPVHEDGPDAESKKFRRKVEAKKLKFKSNEKHSSLTKKLYTTTLLHLIPVIEASSLRPKSP